MKTPISPVSYGPLGLANTLSIRGIGPVNDSGRPNYVYAIQRVTPTIKGQPDDVVSITTGNVAMTADQWANWPTGTTGNEDYQLECIAANLGLTIA